MSWGGRYRESSRQGFLGQQGPGSAALLRTSARLFCSSGVDQSLESYEGRSTIVEVASPNNHYELLQYVD